MALPVPSLHSVLVRGYFPKELPHCFSSAQFGEYAEKHASDLTSGYADEWTRSVRYNLVRPGGGRRVLSIPNPFGYVRLASTFLEGWKDVATRSSKSTLSRSGLRVGDSDERAIAPAHEMKELFELRLRHRAAAGFMVRADVLNFYGSIYTHSIPWVVSGKGASKQRGPKPRVPPWADRLDKALSCVQDGQTNGIDVGPDVSFAVSEMLLSAVDGIVQGKLAGLRGFRFYDDYELYFPERSEAEQGLAVLQDSLLEYELVLNPRKTHVVALPQPLDYGWALEIRRSARHLSKDRSQRDSLVEMFEIAFRLIADGVHDHVLRYTIGEIQERRISPENWPVYEKLLWQASHIEPAVLSAVLGEVLRYRSDGSGNYETDGPLAREVLNQHLVRSLRQSYTHEMAWALWGLIALEQKADRGVTESLCRTTDPVVAVMLLLAREHEAVGEGFSTDAWVDAVAVSALSSEKWLLAYELGIRDEKVGISVAGKGWSSDRIGALFHAMRRADVGFTIDNFGYSERDFESDEYDYSLDADSDEDDDSDGDSDDDDSGGLF